MPKKPSSAADHAALVQEQRDRIKAARSHAQAIRKRPATKEAVLERIKRTVRTAQNESDAPLAALLLTLQEERRIELVNHERQGMSVIDGVVGFIAWLFPGKIEERLLEEAEARLAQAEAAPLDRDELAAELKRLDDEIRDAELAEERAIRAAEAAGVIINRRTDASADALLAE